MLRPVTWYSSALALSAALLTVLGLGCGRATEPSTGGTARLAVSANVAATAIATMVVKVTATDIPTPLVFNLQIDAGGVATGTIVIPAGSNRKIELDAFDANNTQTHHGEATISVAPGTNPTLTIVLVPITGSQPVTATLGTFIITVTKAPTPALPLVGGQTLQVFAVITNNATPPQPVTPVAGELQWASTNPAFFTVSSTGLVTAVKAGSGQVVATFKGFAATLDITVH